MFLCFLGRIGLRAKAAETRISESSRRRLRRAATETEEDAAGGKPLSKIVFPFFFEF